MVWYTTALYTKKILLFLLFISISIFSLSFFSEKKHFSFHLFSICFLFRCQFYSFCLFHSKNYNSLKVSSFLLQKKNLLKTKFPPKQTHLLTALISPEIIKKKEKKGNKHRAKLKHQSKQIFKKKEINDFVDLFCCSPTKKITKPHQSIICLDLFFK